VSADVGQHVETLPGLRTWYDEHGSGDPLVLLHGGMATADSWGSQVPALSERYRVLTPERRGHGHTADVDGPYTYEGMAAETIALLEAVAGGPAHLVGWSDGGNIALLVARDRPDLVRHVVAMGANYHYSGLLPAFFDSLGEDPAGPDLAMFRDTYAAVSPDGAAHWAVVYPKLLDMWRHGPTMTVDDLRTIAPPVLVLVGDDDTSSYEHIVSLFESVQNGQLAVIPGTSHIVPIEKPLFVNQLVLDFLDDGAPVRMFPMRFATES
jgi:pimeloyl-ACP methyl ester carboxylesterase